MKKEKNARKGEGKASTFFFLLLLVALILYVIYMPEVNEYLRKNIVPKIEETIGTNTKKEEESEEEISATSGVYQISAVPEFDFNDIHFKVETLENNLLTLTVNSTSHTTFDDLDYYVEFYKNETEFIGRRALKGNISSNTSVQVDVSGLNITSDDYLAISHISKDAIPALTLRTDESGISKLICERDISKYEYYFELDKLFNIKVRKEQTFDNLEDLAEKKLEYQEIVDKYSKVNGMTASTLERNNTLIYISEYKLSSVDDIAAASENYIFEKDTKNNIVNFTMETEGFNCHE